MASSGRRACAGPRMCVQASKQQRAKHRRGTATLAPVVRSQERSAHEEPGALALEMPMPAPGRRLEAERGQERVGSLVRLLTHVESGAPFFDDLEFERGDALERRRARRAQQLEVEALRIEFELGDGQVGRREAERRRH